MRERRKVQLVEDPDAKGGRSPLVARTAPSNHSRPMSADDIQKAKMRAIHMQEKYGKNSSTSEKSPPKIEDSEASSASQASNPLPANKTPRLPQLKRSEVKKPSILAAKSLSHKPETYSRSNPNLIQQELLLGTLKKSQLQWRTPPGTSAFVLFIFLLLFVGFFLHRNKEGVCPSLQTKFKTSYINGHSGNSMI